MLYWYDIHKALSFFMKCVREKKIMMESFRFLTPSVQKTFFFK